MRNFKETHILRQFIVHNSWKERNGERSDSDSSMLHSEKINSLIDFVPETEIVPETDFVPEN